MAVRTAPAAREGKGKTLKRSWLFAILCKGGEYEGTTPWFVEGLEVLVVDDAVLFEEEGPAFKASIHVYLCLVRRVLQTGRLSNSEESHDRISVGSGTNLKLGVARKGNEGLVGR